MKQTIVTVFGSSAPPAKSQAYRDAFDLGRMIAEAGWTLCNGGYGGTMKAAAQGAVEAGGHTIGVTCRAFRRGGPNAFIRQEVPTFDLLQRLNTLVRLGRAYVVLPGGTGTLLELALVLERANKGKFTKPRPVILLGEYWKPVVECVLPETPEAVMPHIAPDTMSVREILGTHFDPDAGPS